MKIYRGILFLLTIMLPVTICARPMIIDHDGAIEDLLGVVYLMQQPSIQVKAITIAATGEAHCNSGLKNNRALLSILNKNNITVACGDTTSLKGQHAFPDRIRKSADNLMGLSASLPVVKDTSHQTAVDLITKTLLSENEPFDIVALGPLTNVARVFSLHPELTRRVHMIYIMGGAVNVAGNVAELSPETKNNTAEWNFFADAVAARDVISSGLPITLIPLDVTNKMPVDASFYRFLQQQPHKTAFADKIRNMYLRNKYEFITQGWYFWDTLTAFIAGNDSLGTYKVEKLSILTGAENIDGTVKVDKTHGNPVRICTNVSKNTFIHKTFGVLMRV